MIAAHLICLYLLVGVLFLVASRKAVFEEGGAVTALWAFWVLLLWPSVVILRGASRIWHGNL